MQDPDPAAIRLDVLSTMVADRGGWTRGPVGWCVGPFELVAQRAPGLPYELWKGNRCVAAMMAPRDAIAVAECLSAMVRQAPTASSLVGLPPYTALPD